ncbi:sigma-54-dependent transcriptional regulator [Pectinatus haikarae]|uniref:Transcriptional regulatory protein LevR/transcriptional regulator with AAA-type ATPase domain n=1 Tax=Pectinatus haikarae TaxID=349096 RepID=A0ABT9Y921_9FIRM|nr:sigma-54-dependent transcriptional regulator [Pectinatus haikarae]MDQ0204133.1 transcriptional regulatory protein LevR/transcriptional regulator with AAA-type ATPase domain [Pectinatus haikarae]
MKRIERIYAYMRQLYETGALRERGLTAVQIAQHLNILRSNVSRELNELYRQKKIEKSRGRPVLYFYNDGKVKDSLKKIKVKGNDERTNVFSKFVGASLNAQIDQAKAAIIYPPDGLHTLILGQTGVGKTLFAHMMFEYGREAGRFKQNAPFVTFNCADYYNNSQLLISHIFGHIKGAFTGADTSAVGLMESADEGVLFLDEVHRLPPEGQEMIFYFMDTGTFNRLGETKRERKARVLIVCATTEDPDSVLTRTFKRRIPNIIEIPPLSERPIEEKLEITKLLFLKESRCIKRPIKVSGDAIKALIGNIGPGNVGQLESNIRLLCAQGLLNIKNRKYIEIDYHILPQQIKSGILAMSTKRQDMAAISATIGNEFYVTPDSKGKLPKEAEDEKFNLYQMVENKVKILKGEGIADDVVQQVMIADVNAYLKDFYIKQKQNVTLSVHDRLLKIIDADMVDFTQQVADIVADKINLISKERFLYAFGLHLSALFARNKEKKQFRNSLSGVVNTSTLEFELAQEIKKMIEDHYNIKIAVSETEYFAMLLQSLKQEDITDKIVIAVAMHGNYTASSVCDVARKLFSATKVKLVAFDMPLECRPNEMLDRIVEKLRHINCSQGLLLMADMGSLCNFGPLIQEKLNISVMTISMVTTPLVLEAMRKVDMAGITLQAVCDSLKSFGGYDDSTILSNNEKNDIIVTICSSGEGTAEKLKQMIRDILLNAGIMHVKIIPISIYDMKENIKKLSEKYNILASVGIMDPQIEAPFIPLETILSGKDNALLCQLPGTGFVPQGTENGNVVLRHLCADSLNEILLYLNPDKVINLLMEFTEKLEKSFGTEFSNAQKLKIVVHTGCALERQVTHNDIKYNSDLAGTIDPLKLAKVKEASLVFGRILRIDLNNDELSYIASMI